MLREKVVIGVGKDTTKVSCDFWFKNDGPATDIHMGFPDDGNQNEEIEDKATPKSNFMSFRSWVDGKEVPMKLEFGAESYGWHVKDVHFADGQSIHVKDVYETATGSGIAYSVKDQGVAQWARYVVHTGSSWKGNIGETTIVVTYDKTVIPGKLKVVHYKKVAQYDDGRSLKTTHFPAKGTVVYKGIATPTVSGRTLTFVRRNWRPTEAQDLDMWFNFHKPTG